MKIIFNFYPREYSLINLEKFSVLELFSGLAASSAAAQHIIQLVPFDPIAKLLDCVAVGSAFDHEKLAELFYAIPDCHEEVVGEHWTV